MDDLNNDGDIENGKKIFIKKCTRCHDYKEKSLNFFKINLFGLIGRKKRMIYTEKWDEKDLADYIGHPEEVLFPPGKKVVFRQLKDPITRKDLIAFLKSNNEIK